MGHPLALLGWHANLLAERGQARKAGMTVLTGSRSSPQPRSAGATAPMAIGGLGAAHIAVLEACTGAGRARNSLKKDGTMMLQGKRAIVLGGSSGIGLATTNQLASEGATVIAASRHPHRAQESVRAGVELQVCDVQDREALRALLIVPNWRISSEILKL
jgi:NADPH:quinone reductase-like Zn-dependent oxidoreductase